MKSILTAIVMGVIATTTFADGGNTNKTFNLRFYGLAEQLEYEDAIADETGQILGVGGEVGLRLGGSLWMECRGELFGGKGDQDTYLVERTASGSWRKSDTRAQLDTEYLGVEVVNVFAFMMPISKDIYFKPYAGVGARIWEKRLLEMLDEDWISIFGVIGCGGGIAVGKDGVLFARIEARLPFYNEVTSHYSYSGPIPDGTKLEPDGEFSGYAEVGVNMLRMTASLFGETLNVSGPSPSSQEMNTTMYGVKLGLAF